MEQSIVATAKHPLARRLKSRHLQSIAIEDLLVLSRSWVLGYALAMVDPPRLITDIAGWLSAYCVVHALG